MKQVIEDLRAECAALGEFLASLAEAEWGRTTQFFDWTVADEVMHLHLVDDFGRISLTDPASFPGVVADVRAGQAQGIELSQRMRENYGHFDAGALLAEWTKGWEGLCTIFAARSAEDRIPWFGPEMSVASFAAARQMEVWAHGQDVYDLFKVRRTNSDGILSICDLGIRTQGWSFRNRKLERPAPPEVLLTSPSGEVWTWNQGAAERITGTAEDFALVVTQRRHVDDTALLVSGEGARAWMEIAQCFAGAAETPPKAGMRYVDYSGGPGF